MQEPHSFRQAAPGTDCREVVYGPSQQEIKFYDQQYLDNPIPSAGVIKFIPGIGQGAGESSRIGRSVTLVHIDMKVLFFLNKVEKLANVPVPDHIRMMLIVDKQANGALPALTDILENAGSELSFLNLANSSRFTVLLDRLDTLNLSGLTSETTDTLSSAYVYTNWTWGADVSIPMTFKTDLGIITDVTSNNLILLMISAAARTGLNCCIRLRFTES